MIFLPFLRRPCAYRTTFFSFLLFFPSLRSVVGDNKELTASKVVKRGGKAADAQVRFHRSVVSLSLSHFSSSFLVSCALQQSKLADPSDWPTLGSEAAAIASTKKEISNATSNSDLREKDKKIATSSKPKAENSDAPAQLEKAKEVSDGEPFVNDVTVNANGPVPEANASNDKEVNKNVPKAEDGAKRVNAKPKWNRFEVEPKSSAASSQNRRKTDRSPPRRNNRDDYYTRRDDRARDDDRSNRRGNPTRGTVPSSSNRAPRSSAAPVAPATSATAAVGSVKPPSRGPRREPAYITRSNRPSYTESKTPGLNGIPVAPMKSSDPYDAKKQKPLIGRPIIIDPSLTPLVTAQNIYGTYYFNGPTQFSLDAITNVKESIKKQM